MRTMAGILFSIFSTQIADNLDVYRRLIFVSLMGPTDTLFPQVEVF
jgi:hypothetical protein